jgi:hypothetical protein
VTATASAKKSVPYLAVKERLQKVGITKALVIDDAFDLPTLESVKAKVPDFWAQVEAGAAALEELRRLKPDIDNPSLIDNDLIEVLWKQRDERGQLGTLLRDVLFVAKLGDQTSLNSLMSFLASMEVEAIPLGSDQDAPDETVKLIFIDYYLGAVGEASVTHSKGRARALYDRPTESGDRPFVVLMSSRGEVSDAADMFRETSGLIRGLFGYVSKQDFSNPERLHSHFASWALVLPARHKIQRFVETLEAALPKVTEEFLKYVRALGFEEYANIQLFCLQEEGHPLGDYMLGLYKSLLGHLLHRYPKVQELQRDLDAMEFDAFTPYQSIPSPELAEIYGLAMTEPTSEVGHHPRQRAPTAALATASAAVVAPTAVPAARVNVGGDAASEVQIEQPALAVAGALMSVPVEPVPEPERETPLAGQIDERNVIVGAVLAPPFVPILISLGDLFFKPHSADVRVVINAPCDLAFAPNSKRKVPLGRSVLFLCGTLERYEVAATVDGPRTELLKHEGHAYRIAWSRDRVVSVPFEKVEEWLKTEEFSRKNRLALPYALQLQQAFATGATRIGMPVRPPVYRRVSLVVYAMDVDGNYQPCGAPIADGAVVIARRQESKADDEKFVFTLAGVLKTIARLDDVEIAYAARKSRVEESAALASTPASTGNAAAQAKARAGAVQKKLVSLDKLKIFNAAWEVSMRSPMQLPVELKSKNVNDDGLPLCQGSCRLDRMS